MRRLVVLSMVVAAVFGLSVTAAAQEAYCTLGQHVWGHATREFSGIPIPVLLDSLITGADPLVIGMPGRGVTFLDGSEHTITDGLTASWKAAPLPEDLGDIVIDPRAFYRPSSRPTTKASSAAACSAIPRVWEPPLVISSDSRI